MLARYLVEREGASILSRIANGYLSGRTFTLMATEFTATPHDIAELERRFRIWIETVGN
jgi:hypothetical protein